MSHGIDSRSSLGRAGMPTSAQCFANLHLSGPRVGRLLLSVGITAVMLFSSPPSAFAFDYYWISTHDSFRNQFAWTPYVPPAFTGPGGPGDSVHFNRGFALPSRYNVSSVFGANKSMHVHNDALQLIVSEVAGGDVDYLLVDTGSPSFQVGTADGDVADVILTGPTDAVFKSTSAGIGGVWRSSGAVTVRGLEWENVELLEVGIGGTGKLTIENGARVSVASGDTDIGNGFSGDGSVVVSGEGSQLDGRGELTVGIYGSLTIEDGATAYCSTCTIGEGSVNALGWVSVRGAGSRLSSYYLNVGDSIGSLTIRDGGSVSSTEAYLGHDLPWGDGSVTITGEGSSWTTTELVMGSQGEGRVTIQTGGTLRVFNDATLNSKGEMYLQGGTLRADTITRTTDSVFDWDSGTLQVDSFVGHLANDGGALAPGPQAESTAIDGDYTQQVGAALEIELGGLVAGDDHDRVDVTGNFLLGGGDLHLSLLEGFVPNPFHTFTIMDVGGAIFGQFENAANGERLATTDGRGSFVVYYGPHSVFDPTQVVLAGYQPSATIPGDFDFDGDVDGRDFLKWQRGESPNSGSPGDLAAWRGAYGTAATATAAIPEPAMVWIVLVVVAIGGESLWRRNLPCN